MSIQNVKALLITCLLIFALVGCGPPKWWTESFEGQPLGAEQGGTGIVLQLPVPAGKALLCTQGVNGANSHRGTSTKYDLDFDTSNAIREEVFAPVGGIARVHTESPSLNFGNHANIDHGDGTYTVISHMDEIFVADGQEVAVGQLIGYEGCTGACTGDHIHIGVHEGKAELKAEYGKSIPASYFVQDVTADGAFGVKAASDFICGITALGDPVSGHTYRSDLRIALWHPDGSLVKTPGSEKIYRIDNGELRWIVTEDVFWSYGYDFDNVALISEEEKKCLGSGPDISQEGMVEAAYDAETGNLWLIVGSSTHSDRFRQRVRSISWYKVLESWGAPYTASDPPPMFPPDHEFFMDWPVLDGYAKFRDGTLVTPDDASDVLVISHQQALPIKDWDTLLLLGFAGRDIISVDDGDLQIIQEEIGSCVSGIQCIDREAVTVCGGGLEIGSGEQGGTTGGSDGDPDDDPDDTGDEDTDPGDTGNVPDEPIDVDTDGDGVPDADDNCPLHDNGDQGDLDMDGLGDSCDLDADGDGTANVDDCDMFDPAVGPCAPDPDSGEDPDPGPEPEDTGDLPAPNPGSDTLTVSWTTPFGIAANEITLSGEYIFADGSYGFTWRELAEVQMEDDIVYVLEGVGSGDSFRFSVEYEDQMGNVSWSCIGPYPSGTTQGVAEADVDGTLVTIDTVGDPSGLTTGCGLILQVP